MAEYNKLVRDRIPETIEEAEGKKPTIHIASEREYERALEQKLREEVEEFLVNPSAEEAADVLEVIQTICEQKKIDLSQLEELRKKKAEKRGGFKKKIILERTD